MRKTVKYLVVALLACLCLTTVAQAGSIVVSNDEWFTTNGQIGRVNNAQLARNIAGFLTGGSGDILILSSNFGLAGTGLTADLNSWGYNVTRTTTVPGSLAGYEAVFVGGSPAVDNNLLIDYVNAGGSVFLEAGTGAGGAAGEAANWNTLLNEFGLGLFPAYNGVGGDINVSAFQGQAPYGPALFSGVSTVYMNNGNNVILSLGTHPGVQVFNDARGNGLFGAVQIIPASVPEPASMILLGTGVLGFTARLRRKLRG